MGSDLFQRETQQRLSDLAPVTDVPAGTFEGFVRGTGLATMRGFAQTGRAVDLLGSVGPIIQDAVTGGTTLQDRYFQEHDEVFNSAVDRWTPTANEVGIAGEITGQLLSLLPTVVASPALAIGSAQLGEGENLVRKGVASERAQLVGAIQGAGLGLGIWMPVLGTSLAQKVFLGGAGFNTAQGIATRAVSGGILDGTPAEGEYKAFDPASVTLDVLLGMAFGGLAHISPEASARGAKEWDKIKEWANNLTPSDKDALAILREGEHINVDSMPGKPVDLTDVNKHVVITRSAINQILQDKDIQIADLPEPKFEADPVRLENQRANADSLVAEAERVRIQGGFSEPPLETPQSPVETASTPPPEVESPARGGAIEEKQIDPVAQAADNFVSNNPDLRITTGTDANGEPITMTAGEFLTKARETSAEARNDVKLFQIAAECLLG